MEKVRNLVKLICISEFFNTNVQQVMKRYGINHYSTPTKTKWHASMAERAIRTIKSRISRYMQRSKSKRWIDVLDQVVANYNETPHSSHGLKPNDVTDENRREVYKKMFPKRKLIRDCRLEKGDKVRIIRDKKQFEKGYTPNWSDDIFEIFDTHQSHDVCWYKVKDLTGKEKEGVWYYNQLNLVQKNDSSTKIN